MSHGLTSFPKQKYWGTDLKFEVGCWRIQPQNGELGDTERRWWCHTDRGHVQESAESDRTFSYAYSKFTCVGISEEKRRAVSVCSWNILVGQPESTTFILIIDCHCNVGIYLCLCQLFYTHVNWYKLCKQPKESLVQSLVWCQAWIDTGSGCQVSRKLIGCSCLTAQLVPGCKHGRYVIGKQSNVWQHPIFQLMESSKLFKLVCFCGNLGIIKDH